MTLLCGACSLPIPNPRVQIIAFGDSTTTGAEGPGYPRLLAEELGGSQEAVANEGRNGEDTSTGLERLDGLLANQIYPNATVLLYWEGGNDLIDFISTADPTLSKISEDAADVSFTAELNAALAEIQRNIERAILMGREAGLSVFVVTYYPLAPEITECSTLPILVELPELAEEGNRYVLLLNDRIRMAIDNEPSSLIDVAALGEKSTSDPNNYTNCNHLSAQGNEQIAHLIAETLESHGVELSTKSAD